MRSNSGTVREAGAKATRVAVLGGGISGVIVAAELRRRSGILVDLIEKAPRLGGLHRSIVIDGAVYDVGAFLFHRKNRLFTTFPDVADLFVPVTSKYVSVTPRGTLDDYPITVKGYLRDNGLLHGCRACAEIALAKVRYARRHTLTAYIKYYLGHSIYTRSGLKTYIERLYGIPDEDVALEFAHKRLSQIEASASLRGLYTRLRRQWTARTASPVHGRHLVRPREGFDMLYDRINSTLCACGVNVHTGCTIRQVRRAVRGFEIDVNGGMRVYDTVVSTVPLEAMAHMLGMPVEEGPEYVPLFSLFYRFRGDPGHDSTVLHNFTYEGRWKRVTTFSHYYGLHRGDHYFAVEGTLRDGDDVDLPRLRDDFEAHATRLGLYRGQLRYQGGLITGHAYPVYRTANMARVVALKEAIQGMGIDIAGRQGEFDYISSSDAAGNAQAVADRIAAALTGGGRGDGRRNSP